MSSKYWVGIIILFSIYNLQFLENYKNIEYKIVIHKY